jgi:hypothetical protein
MNNFQENSKSISKSKSVKDFSKFYQQEEEVNMQTNSQQDLEKFSVMSQKDSEEFSKMVIDNISRFNSQHNLEGMNFDSSKNSITWNKVFKLNFKPRNKSRFDFIMEESMSDQNSESSYSHSSSSFVK